MKKISWFACVAIVALSFGYTPILAFAETAKQFVEIGPPLKNDDDAKEKCPFLCEEAGNAPISGENSKWTGKWSPTKIKGKAESICECEVDGKQFVIEGPALKDDTEAKEKCPFICEAGGSAPIGGKNCQWTGQWSPTTLGDKAGSICQCTTTSEEVVPATTTK